MKGGGRDDALFRVGLSPPPKKDIFVFIIVRISPQEYF